MILMWTLHCAAGTADSIAAQMTGKLFQNFSRSILSKALLITMNRTHERRMTG